MKKLFISLFVVVLGLSFVLSTVNAATVTYKIGNDASSRPFVDTYTNFSIVDTNHSVTIPGSLTNFNYFASNLNSFRFFLIDSTNTVQWLSDEITPNLIGINTFTPTTPVNVMNGWNVGMYFKNSGTIPFSFTGSEASYTSDNYGIPTINNPLSYEGTSNRTYSFVANENVNVDFNADREISPDKCAKVGSPLINVNQKVKNDADSGMGGNYWGLDAFNRHIQVWKTNTANTYCALVSFDGTFSAIAGEKSPGNTGILSGNESGKMIGGYRAIINGTLNSDVNTKGNLGTYDYKCDNSGVCPGYFDWVNYYFKVNSFDQPWWGWMYTNGTHVWINSSDGTIGDII